MKDKAVLDVDLGIYYFEDSNTLCVYNDRISPPILDCLVAEPIGGTDLFMVGVSSNERGDLTDGIYIGLNEEEARSLVDTLSRWLDA